MNIRFANKKDLPQIIELCKEHAEYERAEYEQKNKAELLSEFIFGQNPSLKCLIVEQDNSIIGYATFMKQFSTWDADF
jgi:L-amino acid N-acyltransferase YncA